MKSSIIPFLLLLTFSFPGQAQTDPEPPDTIKLIKNPEKVTVSRTGDTTVIQVETTDEYGSDTFTYEVTIADSTDADAMIDFEIPLGIGKNKKDRRTKRRAKRRLRTSMFLMGNVYIGHRFNYFDKGNVKNSYEAGVRNLVGIRWSHGRITPSFSIGLGFGTQRYSARSGFQYAMDGSDLILIPAADGSRVRSTDLQVWNFQVPLLLTVPIGRVVEFQVGAIGYLNTYAKARTHLDSGDYRTKTSYKGLQQRLFTAEPTIALGVCDILGVYASWSPMPLFKSPYGQELKSWSIGATINF